MTLYRGTVMDTPRNPFVETDALSASNSAVKAGKMVAERHPWMVPDGVLPAGFKVPRP